ncbi:MAG: acyltransferase [Terracidiphilus sp.]
MRAFAVLLVMWAHLKFVADFGPNPFFKTAAGASGVDVFFVISGFVISMSAERLRFDWRSFLTNRLCRIAPFYWLMSAPLAVYLFFFRHLTWQSLLNSIAFIPLLDFHKFSFPANSFGWTLSFEFWFYTFFAIMMAILGARALVVMAPLLAILCAIVGFGYRGAWFTPCFLFHPLTLEFAAGIVLYQVRKLCGAKTMAVAALLMLVLGWMTLQTQILGWHANILASPALGFERACIWGGFGATLVTLAVSIDNLQLIRWPQWAVSLGDCSYSMYLIQPYALVISKTAGRMSGVNFWISVPLFITSIILGGFILSKCIEMPLTRWSRQRVNSLRARA